MTATSDEAVGRATLDIFSGRPNPTWTLTEAQTRQLERRVTGLSAKLPEAPDIPDLGYRGIRVTLPGQPRTVELTVARGGIEVQRNGSVTHFSDADRQMERWLLQTAQGKVSQELLQLAERELSAPR